MNASLPGERPPPPPPGRRRALRLAALLLVAGCSSRPALRVAAAISLEPWLEGALGDYRAAHHGARVEATYGASGILERQIAGGAPVDVFLSASPREVDELGSRALARQLLAHNRLVLALSRDAVPLVHAPADLLSPAIHRVALGRPASVPAGRYAQQALERLSLWKPLQGKLLYANHVAEVRAWVTRGDVEAGFVYASEATGLPAVLELPGAPEVRLVAALLSPAGRPLYDYLVSAERASSLRAAGFAPP